MVSSSFEDSVYRHFIPGQDGRPLIITSPHSGRYDPESILHNFNFICDPEQLARLEDRYVDLLCEGLDELGAHVLMAQTPRSYIDLSRARDCIDPSCVPGGLKILSSHTGGDNRRFLKVGTGLVFLRSTINHFQIYHADQRPNEEQIADRLRVWDAFHGKLSDIFNRAQKKFGNVYHLDLHSCWRRVVRSDGTEKVRPDIVISDYNGHTTCLEFAEVVKDSFERQGLNVQMNNPFKGGYIIKRYGRPEKGVHSLQIEIARDLYLNERTLDIDPEGLAHIRAVLREVTADVMRFFEGQNAEQARKPKQRRVHTRPVSGHIAVHNI